jgi:type IV pilus assembly protein PilM
MSVIVDFQILGRISDAPDSKYRVLAAAVKKDIIEILSGLTTELGMEVMAFDTSTLGVFNLFENLRPDSCVDQTVIHCHIGHETTVIKAYGSGSLIYERVIEVGGEEFTHSISMLDQLDFESATSVKEKEKFFPSQRKDIPEMLAKRDRIEAIFGNWLRELNVTFRFFQEKFKTNKLPSIMITGGGAKFSGLAEFLSEYLDTNCLIFNPLTDIPLSGKVEKQVFESGPIAAPGIGLLVK